MEEEALRNEINRLLKKAPLPILWRIYRLANGLIG
jgi:hypothetical protein